MAIVQSSNNWSAMRATIVGLGREGAAVARFLAERGATVTVTDLKGAENLQGALTELAGLPVTYCLESHPLDLLDTDVLFVSPGVPLDAPFLVEARRRRVVLSSESRLFSRLCPAHIVGITGSSGKTTTSTLVHRMLTLAGKRAHLGGNIGRPLIRTLSEISAGDTVVMELSSFQLDFCGVVLDAEPFAELVTPLFPAGTWSPQVAAVLNVTPNHLDRHPTMASYTAAKRKIIQYQRPDDVAVLSWDDPVARGFAAECVGRVSYFSLLEAVPSGAFLADERIVSREGGVQQTVCSANEVRLRGRHNVANVLAACSIATELGVPTAAMAEVARSFEGVEHRLEPVRVLEGVRYFNDSIATSPERAIAALRSFSEPIVLLAGGRDKHLPWEQWAQVVGSRAICVITFGEAAALIEDALKHSSVGAPPLHRAVNLTDAVAMARSLASAGQVVLLSPGGTSYDAFRDYEERGQAFKQLVHALK